MIDARVEVLIGGQWTDATGDTLVRDGINITRGRADELSTEPSTCALTFDNRLGKYSPLNPLGAYYGKIGRNTRARVRIGPNGAPGNLVPNSTFETDASGWQAYSFGYGGGSVAQSAVRAWQGTKSALVTWPTSAGTSFIGTSDGQVDLVVGRQYTLSMYVYVPTGNPNVRATLGYLSTGSYTSTKDAWVRITHTFTAPVSTSPFKVGVESAAGTTAGQQCWVDGVMLQEGSAATTFLTTAPVNFPRFHGELSELPQRWGNSVNEAFVPVRASGILRRIGRSDQPVISGLKNFLLSTTMISYWPLDDGATATKGAVAAGSYQGSSLYPAFTTGVRMNFAAGALADYLPAALRVDDTVAVGGTGGPSGYITGRAIGTSATPDSLAWEFLFRGDPTLSGSGTNPGALTFEATVEGSAVGTFDRWTVQTRRGANNDLALSVTIDALGAAPLTIALADTAALSAITDGQMHHLRFQLTQNGANTDYAVYLDGSAVITGTQATYTLRRSASVTFTYDRDGSLSQDLIALGHVIVWETLANIPSIASTYAASIGFATESAGRRIQRLCGETGTPFVSIGDLDDTLMMGLQYEDNLPNQFAEIEDTDQGFIYEPPDSLAVGYRTLPSMYNQTAVTLDYAAGEFAPALQPTYDDQSIVNDVFTQRREGSSYEARLDSGALSVLDPPNGVGKYKAERTVNVRTDDDLPPIAGWLLGKGTVEAARYPQIVVDLHVIATTDPALVTALLGIRPGDRLVGTNLDAVGIYDDIDLLVLGWSEFISSHTHTLTFNCAPYGPYVVAVVDDANARIDPDGTLTLAAAATSTATSLSIASSGALATTDVADYPCSVMVAGEEITITAMSGASSPQTATVTRSVNGVVKAQASGAVVNLKIPGQVAL